MWEKLEFLAGAVVGVVLLVWMEAMRRRGRRVRGVWEVRRVPPPRPGPIPGVRCEVAWGFLGKEWGCGKEGGHEGWHDFEEEFARRVKVRVEEQEGKR